MHKGYAVIFAGCMVMIGYGLFLLHSNQGTGLEPLNAVGIVIWTINAAQAWKKTFKK